MKQTAVEWLLDQLIAIGQLEIPEGSNVVTSIVKQAKETEKEQMVNAVIWFDDTDRRPHQIEIEAEQYYNETFKSE